MHSIAVHKQLQQHAAAAAAAKMHALTFASWTTSTHDVASSSSMNTKKNVYYIGLSHTHTAHTYTFWGKHYFCTYCKKQTQKKNGMICPFMKSSYKCWLLCMCGRLLLAGLFYAKDYCVRWVNIWKFKGPSSCARSIPKAITRSLLSFLHLECMRKCLFFILFLLFSSLWMSFYSALAA